MSRATRDAWAMELARVTARRSTCLRRSVGCVLLNARGHVLATGYNGVAAGLPHCNDERSFDQIVDSAPPEEKYNLLRSSADMARRRYPHACQGAFAKSGQNLDGCEAIHAEQNALLQCRDPHDIAVCYVTTSPCMTCTKLLLNTSCQRIVYVEEYAHTAAADLWRKAGRIWERFTTAA